MSLRSDPDWTIAACRDHDTNVFFPESGYGRANDWRTPKAICAGCEIRHDCLAWAIANDQRYGVWGGTSERARTRLIQAAKRAAS